MASRKTKRTRASRKARASSRDAGLLEQANQIWMAGVGALSRAQKEGPKAFENLVREGLEMTSRTRSAAGKALRDTLESVQDAFESRVKDARDQASETVEHLERMIQIRVHRALHQLGVPTADELNRLTRKVNELNRNVEALARKRRSRKGPAARKSRTVKSAAAG